jgi:Caspase domain
MSLSRFLTIALCVVLPGIAAAQQADAPPSLAAPAAAAAAAPAATDKPHRVALVMGNNDYKYVDPLKNAVTDAQSMQVVLQQLGFQVIYVANGDRRQMYDGLDAFVSQVNADTDALVYYSGHGVQIDGTNYLAPTDLQARNENDVKHDAIDLQQEIVDRIGEANARFTLVIMDACRNNPFKGTGRAIGAVKGLAPMMSASGVMLLYAAGSNQEALDRLGDDDHDPNGLFTREFLIAMKNPNRSVYEVITEVRTAVTTLARSVGHAQTPALYDESSGDFSFAPSETAVAAGFEMPTPTPTPAPPPVPTAALTLHDEVKSGASLQPVSDAPAETVSRTPRPRRIYEYVNAAMCPAGTGYRNAFPHDHVCVPLRVQQETTKDNAAREERIDPAPHAAFGPQTCRKGYVWREAVPTDRACVTPAVRTRTAQENRGAYWRLEAEAAP